MRIAVGLLALALGAAPAWADDADSKPVEVKSEVKSAPKLRVVRVMPESKQALLFDKTRATHVLVELGGWIEGFKVTEIDDDSGHARQREHGGRPGGADASQQPEQQHESGAYAGAEGRSRPERSVRGRRREGTGGPVRRSGNGTGRPVRGGARTRRRGAEDDRARQRWRACRRGAQAGRTRDVGARYGRACAGCARTRRDRACRPAPAPTAVATAPAAPAPAPATPAPPSVKTADIQPGPATAAATIPLTMTRAAFQQELADFGRLATSIKAAFTDNGAHIDSIVAGSLFARAGLLAGDVVTAVGDHPLRSIDDAADLYAHASSVKNIAIQVVRAGKPVTLRITIQ